MSTTTTQARDGASGASAPSAAALKQKKVAAEDAGDAAATAKGRPALSGARPDDDGGNETADESGDESVDSDAPPDEPGNDADAAPQKKGAGKASAKKGGGGAKKAPVKRGGKSRGAAPRKRRAAKTTGAHTTAVYKNRVESVNKNRVFVNATFVTFIKCVLREELGFGNRVRKDLLFALAEVHRQWAESTLEAGTEAASHCKRKTIMPADVDLLRSVRKLQKDVNFTPSS